MHSEPPPKHSANAKAVGVYLEDPRSLFVPWTIASIFSAADIVFLVTVLPFSVCRCVAHMSNRFSKRFSSSQTAAPSSSASSLSSLCVEPWVSAYESVTIVIRACRSCRGDESRLRFASALLLRHSGSNSAISVFRWAHRSLDSGPGAPKKLMADSAAPKCLAVAIAGRALMLSARSNESRRNLQGE